MKIQEKFLYEIWKEKKFTKTLTTSDSQIIEIVDFGLQNKNLAGPDFLNSRIKIGNITYLGDVEIDTVHADWKSHGHYLDKNYNKVILHVVLSKDRHQPYVFTKDGRKVNSICLSDFLEQSIQQSLQMAIKAERKDRIFTMPCSGKNSGVPNRQKLEFLFNLGIERFKKKSKRILERLKQMVYLKEMNIHEPVVSYDFGEDFINKKYNPEDFNDHEIWQQLAYEMIFEALGYSKNKDLMLKLSRSVNIQFLAKHLESNNFLCVIESALLSVSGLVPSKRSFKESSTSEYVRTLVEKWDDIKKEYDGPTFTGEQWHFFKMRPYNFPTVRLAGGARLISRLVVDNLLMKLIKLFETDSELKKISAELRNLIIVNADGFWKNHFVFEKKSNEDLVYFVGVSRADEIIVNVFLPVLNLYFELFSNHESSKRVKELYLNYFQKSSNQLVNQVSNTLGIQKASRKSVYYQGLIELFRNYCVKERCLECKIGKEIFN